MRCKVILSVAVSFVDIEVKKGLFIFRKRISRLRRSPRTGKKNREKRGTGVSLKRWVSLAREARGVIRIRKIVVTEKRAFTPELYALYYGLIFWWTPGIVVRRSPDMKREFVIESDVDVNIKKGGVFLWKRRRMF